MNKLPAKRPPKALSQEERSARFRRAAAICAGLCLGLCLVSFLINNHGQAVMSATEATASTHRQIDRLQTNWLKYLYVSTGILGCLVGWAVPTIQISSCGKPIIRRFPKGVIIFLLILAVAFASVILSLPWLVSALKLLPSALPYSYWEPNAPWPFYGAYRVLIRLYRNYALLDGFLFMAIAIGKLCVSIKLNNTLNSPENLSNTSCTPKLGRERPQALLSPIIYLIFYILLITLSFSYDDAAFLLAGASM